MVIMELGILFQLTNIIMNAISSVQMHVNWNGSKCNYFKYKKGLHQCDPISPYIFFLCMDKLSNLILDMVDDNRWVGIKDGRKDPLISHLMLVNNLLLFDKAIESQISNMMDVLDTFCAASGQLISKEKTKIMFSSNTSVGIHRIIAAQSGFREIDDLGWYFGVSLSNKSLRNNNFQFLIGKVRAKLSHWKCNQLSFAGRVTLTKAIINEKEK